MNKHRWTAILIMTLLALVLTANVLAMTSPGYKLEWYTPGTGGGEASSASYAVEYTVGQPTIGTSSSASYTSGFGTWYGLLVEWIRSLPIIFR